jgi:hypothetical protein
LFQRPLRQSGWSEVGDEVLEKIEVERQKLLLGRRRVPLNVGTVGEFSTKDKPIYHESLRTVILAANMLFNGRA